MTYSGAASRATFKSQLDIFLANPGWRTDDVTIVYLGYNDIARSTDSRWATLTQAKVDYRVGWIGDRCRCDERQAPAGAGGGHDWSKNPSTRQSTCRAPATWWRSPMT